MHKIIVRKAPGRNRASGILTFGNRSFRCLLGRNGISVNKHEGDMTTPAGKYRLLFGFFRKDRLGLLSTDLPFSATSEYDGWCDDPENPNYNRRIKLPFSASRETLMRKDALYDIVIVMDHNYSNRIRGRGSAVFFHLTAEKEFTAGCVAVSRKDMLQILPHVTGRTYLEVLP